MGIDVMSQMLQGNARSAEANYRAQVALNQQQLAQRNAALLEQRARTAEQQGSIDEDRLRQRTSQLIGAQRAALAAQGGDINDGSAVDLVGDTARAGAFDALSAGNAAARRAYDWRLRAAEAENEG